MRVKYSNILYHNCCMLCKYACCNDLTKQIGLIKNIETKFSLRTLYFHSNDL